MRVAVAQFATSANVQENLASCIRMINEAATCQPSLIVLPEFCNTLFCNTQPCYVDHDQAWYDALSINGEFLQRIAEQAQQHHCYIALSVTIRRDDSRDLTNNKQGGTIKANISVTSCLFSPLGKLIQQVDKQALSGHEKDYFISTNNASEVATTPFGKLGLLSGSDDMTFSASRGLALNGAQLLSHSLNSFALDQSHLHGPARACENKVFLATANKVGSLVPSVHSQKEQDAILSAQSSIHPKYLVGVGQSQIIAPDGKVLAKISSNEEGFIFADIDLAVSNKKFRPDGTELFKQRRPELYQGLTAQQVPVNNQVPATVNVAIFATYKSNEQAIEDVCHYIENNLSDIIQLPELFFIADKAVTNDGEKRAKIASLSKQLIVQISAVLRPFQYVCTSLVIEGMHQAVLISEQGLFAKQPQLHFCQRYQWTALGDDLTIIELPLEQGSINLAMLTADDANIPEIANVAALKGSHLLLVPFDIQEACEVEYSLLARAAENKICIVAASREKSFSNDSLTENFSNNNGNKKKIKTLKSTGFIANLTKEPTLLTLWKSDKFGGYINQPQVKHQHGKITKALIHPLSPAGD